MRDKKDNLNCEFIKPIEVEDRQDAIMSSEDFRTDLGQIIVGIYGQDYLGRSRYDSVIEVIPETI